MIIYKRKRSVLHLGLLFWRSIFTSVPHIGTSFVFTVWLYGILQTIYSVKTHCNSCFMLITLGNSLSLSPSPLIPCAHNSTVKTLKYHSVEMFIWISPNISQSKQTHFTPGKPCCCSFPPPTHCSLGPYSHPPRLTYQLA